MRLFLHASRETLELQVAADAALRAGQLVEVTGRASGGRVIASRVSAPLNEAAAGTCSAIGEQKTAVILVSFPSKALLSLVTPALMHDSFFGTGRSLDAYLREASFGQTRATGDVLGPFVLDADYFDQPLALARLGPARGRAVRRSDEVQSHRRGGAARPDRHGFGRHGAAGLRGDYIAEKRLDDLYRATGAVTEVENNLKTPLARERHDSLWNDELVADGKGAAAPPSVIEVGEAVADVIGRHPERKVIDANNANNAANGVQKAQNAGLVKPRMTLVASCPLAGLAGRIRPGLDPISTVATPLYERVDALSGAAGLAPLPTPQFGSLPNSLAGGFGSSLSSLFGGNYQTVQAGVAFDFTVHNRTAEANLADAAIARKRLELMRDRAQQAIEAQVRNALQALETARQRVEAANASERATREKLESESRLFASGESTNFLVLTRQNEYSGARRREVEAEAAFHKAVAQYEAALGTTLTSRNITVE